MVQYGTTNNISARGSWLRQKSCQEMSVSRCGGIIEAGFV